MFLSEHQGKQTCICVAKIYPIGHIIVAFLLHDLSGATVFSHLDLQSGYHQLKLTPESRYITTFYNFLCTPWAVSLQEIDVWYLISE